jgi:hypothetical protein
MTTRLRRCGRYAATPTEEQRPEKIGKRASWSGRGGPTSCLQYISESSGRRALPDRETLSRSWFRHLRHRKAVYRLPTRASRNVQLLSGSAGRARQTSVAWISLMTISCLLTEAPLRSLGRDWKERQRGVCVQCNLKTHDAFSQSTCCQFLLFRGSSSQFHIFDSALQTGNCAVSVASSSEVSEARTTLNR